MARRDRTRGMHVLAAALCASALRCLMLRCLMRQQGAGRGAACAQPARAQGGRCVRRVVGGVGCWGRQIECCGVEHSNVEERERQAERWRQGHMCACGAMCAFALRCLMRQQGAGRGAAPAQPARAQGAVYQHWRVGATWVLGCMGVLGAGGGAARAQPTRAQGARLEECWRSH
jgi:hypothetical protein